MDLETISMYEVVEARGGNELILRMGEEGSCLGHGVKEKKLTCSV